MKPFLVWFLSLGLFAVVGASAVQAQSGPEKGGHELELWTGGGHGVKGVASDAGFLRGKFEYAVDAVPIFWVFQPGGAAYGVAVDPFAFKWNFNAHGRVVPYADLDGGALVSNRQIPPGTSRVNFTPGGALGMHILGKRWTWSAEVRYMHISNAGISALNPGINTLQLRVSVGIFTRPRGN